MSIEKTDMEILINGLVAVATLFAVAVAIWGDWFRSVFAAPKLKIVGHTLKGESTHLTIRGALHPSGGFPVIYYHLKVINLRSWLAVHNCQVLLKAISRRGPDGVFHPEMMAVPFQFVWAPAKKEPELVTITNERVFDFGRIQKNGDFYFPMLYQLPNNFRGLVRKNEAVRYFIEINATNYVSSMLYVFDVSWDGVWDDDLELMSTHLRVTELAEGWPEVGVY